MKINELCTRCGVTKKAVAYAMEQGLLAPRVAENGYREFSDDDARRMSRIAVLRALGMNTADIAAALTENWEDGLRHAALRAEESRMQQEILTRLAAEGDWIAARENVRTMQRTLPLTQRLKAAFPGPFGAFMAAHFAPYLPSALTTDDQQSAWDAAIAWLDETAFTVPADLADVWQTMAPSLPDAAAVFHRSMEQALNDQQSYIEAHRAEIKAYQAFKASEAYKTSDAARMEKLLRDFMAQSGYHDVFIPLLRRISPLYDAYQQRLQAANAAFIAAMNENTKEAPSAYCQTTQNSVK